MRSQIYRYAGEHPKLGANGERCEGSYSVIQAKGAPLPPLSQTVSCFLCGATALMTLNEPEQGTDVAMGTDIADVMGSV